MKILLEAVKNEDKISKGGKNYSSCSIKTIGKDGQDVWISGFGNNVTKSWKKGQTIDLDVFKEEYQGKEYWKFKEVADRSILDEIDKINAKLDKLLGVGKDIQATPAQLANMMGGEIVKPEVRLEDIPF